MKTRVGRITQEYGLYFAEYRMNGKGRRMRKWFPDRLSALRFLVGKPKPNAYDKIRYAMLRDEREALRLLRKANAKGKGFMDGYFLYMKACDRLLKKEKVVWRNGRGPNGKGRGYWVVN